MLALVRISGEFDMKGSDSLCVGQYSTCASACALVFLAGLQRFSEGRLVVHQYLPPVEQGDEKNR